MRIGEIEVTSVLDGRFLYAPPAGFPHPDDPEFLSHNTKFAADGRWIMDIGAFLVRTGDHVALIDAGGGPGDMQPAGLPPFTGEKDAHPKLVAFLRSKGLSGAALQGALAAQAQTEVRYGLLEQSLARIGVSRGDVTDVILTHLHWDHIGWVSDDGRPTFPNATYRCERQDAEHFLGDVPYDETFSTLMCGALPAAERLAPIRDRLELWDRDAPILPGVDAMFAPGHTPGSCVIVLSSGEERALLLGDVVHCPLQLTNTEFSLMADMDPALAARSREAVARELEGGKVQASAPHFPDLKFGRMLPGVGRRWTFAP